MLKSDLSSFMDRFILFFTLLLILTMALYPNYLFFEYHISDLGAFYLISPPNTQNRYAFIFIIGLLLLATYSGILFIQNYLNRQIKEALFYLLMAIGLILTAFPTDLYHSLHRLGAIILFFTLWFLLIKYFYSEKAYYYIIAISIFNFIYCLYSFHILSGCNPLWQKISFCSMILAKIIFNCHQAYLQRIK